MQQLTEREQVLLEIIKKLINLNTLLAVYEDKSKQWRNWAYANMKEMGITAEWQDEALKQLEAEFGLVYAKIAKETLEEKAEESGDKN